MMECLGKFFAEHGADFVEIMVSEAHEHLGTIEEKILLLEREPDDAELINEIFRAIHSIKGNAGFLGYGPLNRLSHETETVLDMARKGRLHIDHAVVNTLLEAADGLKALTHHLADALAAHTAGGEAPSALPAAIEPLCGRLQQLTHTEPSGSKPASAPSQAESRPVARPADPGDSDEAAPARLGDILVEEGAVTPGQLEAALAEQQRPIGQVLVERGAVTEPEVKEALRVQQTTRGRGIPTARDDIRVRLDRLDGVIDLVGELTVTGATLINTLHTLGHANGHGGQLSALVEQFEKLTADLQDRTMAMRMVPVRGTFQKMRRVVRDLGRKTGKRVELCLSGEDTELDKTVVEEFTDPLMHLVRNAIDHGIEPAAEREAAGKPPMGHVRLDAYHAAGEIVIEVRDDGRGIDPAAVLAKARAEGLVETDTTLSTHQIYQLLFMPGFSLTAEVTEISGRGVGMDVVKKNIARLRGRIEVESTLGDGSLFRIKVPLTLAIIHGMVVRVGRERYIIPVSNIQRSLRPTPAQVCGVYGRAEYINARGALLPLIRLHRLYGISPQTEDPSESLVVIVADSTDEQAALLVDEVLGEQQIVVKALGDLFRHEQGISGATVMADARIALILDIPTLIALAQADAPHAPDCALAPLVTAEAPHITAATVGAG